MNRARHYQALPAGYRLHWYELGALLGEGGFGISYLARDTNLGQPAVIKEFLPTGLAARTRTNSVRALSGDLGAIYARGLEQFVSEARALAALRHPSIVRVSNVFEANDTAYMVMEFERGASFEAALKSNGAHAEMRLKEILLPLLDGLELVHDAGLVHGDINPSNIYLRDDGRPVLLDFGAVRLAMGVETHTLTSLLSPGYTPFEQYSSTRERDRLGPWTDVYGLGATMYRAVMGKDPVDAAVRANLILDGERDPYDACARRQRNGYSPAFLHALDRALEFRALDRPQSMAEWRALLLAEHLALAAPAPAVNEEEASIVRAMDLMLEAHDYPDAVSVQTFAAAPPADEPAPASPPGPARHDRWVLPGALVMAAAVVAFGWLYSQQLRDPAPTPPRAAAPASAQPSSATVPLEHLVAAHNPRRVADDEPAATADDAGASASGSDAGATAAGPAPAESDIPEAETLSAEAAELVRTMLAQADDDVAALRLTTPAGGNAFERYLEVLAVDPVNRAARDGLLAIAGRYLELARGAARKGDNGRVEGYLARAESVLEEAQRLGGSENAVAEQLALHGALRERSSGAPEQAVEESTESAAADMRYRVAIFPFAKASLKSLAADRELIEFANTFVRDSDAYELAFSYYGDRSGAGELGASLENMWSWKAGSTLRTPKVDEVFRLGKALDVDAVLTYAYQDGGEGSTSSTRYKVEGYVFDIGLKQVHQLSANQSSYQQKTRNAFATLERRRADYRRLARRVGTPTTYRQAMLPPHGVPGCDACDAAEELRRNVQPLFEGHPAVRLSPAFFDEVRPAALDDDPAQWWSEIDGARLPDRAAIRPFAIDNDVDAVLIFSYSDVNASRWERDVGTVHAFIYDVAQDRLFERIGKRRELADVARNVLSDFLGAHDQ